MFKSLNRLVNFSAPLLACVLAAGCATHSPAPVTEAGSGQVLDTGVERPSTTDSPQAQQPDAAPSPAPSSQPTAPALGNGRNSAVDALLSRSDDEYNRGKYQQSVATAERALRIDRRSAEVYLLLAKNYWRLGDEPQAAQFARQGLRYSGDDRSLTWQLERILAKVTD